MLDQTILNLIRIENSKEIIELSKLLSLRKIDSLYHFTNLDNLESIISSGALLPIEELKKMKRGFVNSDVRRKNSESQGICLSVSWPNFKMLASHWGGRNYLDGKWIDKHYAVLKINSKVLLNRAFLSFPTNSARFEKSLADNYSDFKGVGAFEKLFFNGHLASRDRKFVYRNELGISSRFPTDPQAEILLFDSVPISLIEEIHIEERNKAYLSDLIGDDFKINQKMVYYSQASGKFYWNREGNWEYWIGENTYLDPSTLIPEGSSCGCKSCV